LSKARLRKLKSEEFRVESKKLRAESNLNNQKSKIHFYTIDRATIIYLAILSFLIILFSNNQPHWPYYILYNILFVVIILLIVRYLSDEKDLWKRFFRHWYPMVLFTFLYEEIRHLVHIIFPGWFDTWINQVELKLFGEYPTVWLQKLVSVPLNEYMMLSYFSYYFLMPVMGAALYFKNKIKEFDQFLLVCAVAFYISYLGFIFMPVEGPRYAISDLHNVELVGIIFTPLAQYVIKIAGLHGGCMPSSHVAVALVVMIYALRHTKVLAWIFTPLIISLFIGTVYGRFHYFLDVVAGILVGLLALLVCERFLIPKTNRASIHQETV
jgi:membrane-associated phospholipid phosphatase